MATWKTVTVGTTGTYATLNAAQAAEATDLTAQSGDIVFSCQAFEDTTQAVFASTAWDSDATHRVVIQAADDHGGKWSTSAYRMVGATSRIVNQAVNYMKLEGIQINMTGTGTNAQGYLADTPLDAVGETEIDKLIVMGVPSATQPDGVWNGEPLHDIHIRNSIIYGLQIGIGNAGTGSKIYADNITVDDCLIGVYDSYGSHRLRNCRVTNCPTILTGGGTLDSGSDYNLTNSTGAVPTNWGSNSISSTDSPTINYVTSTGTLTARDYHIVAGDSGIGAGVNLSTSFTDDIDGETRG